METPQITPEDVQEVYLVLLGRPAESEDVIGAYIENCTSKDELWRAISSSSEFERRIAFGDRMIEALHDALYADQSRIRHTVSEVQLKALLDRVRSQWTELGSTEPHWSVLVEDRFRGDQLDDAAKELFNASGLQMAQLLELFEARTGQGVGRGICLELGCGVGRITRHLAKMFDKVIAADISPGNLKVCEAELSAAHISNVELRLIAGPEDFRDFPEFDLFFSVIVLQHNSPPVQKWALEQLLSRIRPGGGALFQIPTGIPHYGFDLESYLESPQPEMEMHALPASVVLRIIRDCGLSVEDVTPDPFIGAIGSLTFFASRPSS